MKTIVFYYNGIPLDVDDGVELLDVAEHGSIVEPRANKLY